MAKLYTKNTWTDEILAGDELYTIAQSDDTPINENVKISLSTAVTTAGTTVSAEKMNNIENGIDAIDNLVVVIDGEVDAIDSRVDNLESTIETAVTGKHTETLSSNLVLLDTDPIVQFLDPGAADRTITLPDVSANNHAYIISNTSGSDKVLTVNDESAVEVGVVVAGETKHFVSDGAVWRQLTTGSAGSGGGDVLEVQVFS